MKQSRPKSSRQKIMQLKDELSSYIDINQSPTLQFTSLKESYVIARKRSLEVKSTNELNLYLKSHCQKASQLYSALATLIYSSMSIGKTKELENYIKVVSSEIPSLLFDMEEWAPVLDAANKFRNGNTQNLMKENSLLKKLDHFQKLMPLNSFSVFKNELEILKGIVQFKLNEIESEFRKSFSLVNQSVIALKNKSDSNVNSKELTKLKKENEKLVALLKNDNIDPNDHIDKAEHDKLKSEMQNLLVSSVSDKEKLNKREEEIGLLKEQLVQLEKLKKEIEDLKTQDEEKVKEDHQIMDEVKKSLIEASGTQATDPEMNGSQAQIEEIEALRVALKSAQVEYADMEKKYQKKIEILGLEKEALVKEESVSSSQVTATNSLPVDADEVSPFLEEVVSLRQRLEVLQNVEKENAKLKEDILNVRKELDNQNTLEEGPDEVNEVLKEPSCLQIEDSTSLNPVNDQANISIDSYVKEIQHLKTMLHASENETERLKSELAIQKNSLQDIKYGDSIVLEENNQKNGAQSNEISKNITEEVTHLLNSQISDLNSKLLSALARQNELEVQNAQLVALLNTHESSSLAKDNIDEPFQVSKFVETSIKKALQNVSRLSDRKITDDLLLIEAPNNSVTLSIEEFNSLKEAAASHFSYTSNEKSSISENKALNEVESRTDPEMLKQMQVLKEETDRLQYELTELKSKLEAKDNELTEINNQSNAAIESYCVQIDYLKQELTSSQQQINERNQIAKSLEDQMKSEFQNKNETLSKMLAELNHTLESKDFELNQLRQDYQKVAQEKEVRNPSETNPTTSDVIKLDHVAAHNVSLVSLGSSVSISSAKDDSSSVSTVLSKLCSPRNATHYEAQRLVLKAVKKGIININSSVSRRSDTNLLRKESKSHETNLKDQEVQQKVSEIQFVNEKLSNENYQLNKKSELLSQELYEAQRLIENLNQQIQDLFVQSQKDHITLNLQNKTISDLEDKMSSQKHEDVPYHSIREKAERVVQDALSEYMQRIQELNEGSRTENRASESMDMVLDGGESLISSLESVNSYPNSPRAFKANNNIFKSSHSFESILDPTNLPHRNEGFYEAHEKDITRIQSIVRMFLGRKKVEQKAFEVAASKQGVLAAYHGTKQGEPGWYSSQDQLFYFCQDQGEFILLCGPIKKELYQLALDEISLSPRFRFTKSFPLDLKIDRLGVHATRIQIETLLDDIQNRDQLLEQLYDEFLRFRSFSDAEKNKTIKKYQSELDRLHAQILEYQESIQQLEAEISSLNHKLKLPSIEQKLSDMVLDSKLTRAFVKLTSIARGYLGRIRFNRIKSVKLAEETGVLIALKNTIQGKSGWYVAPDGMIYYFLNDKGNWRQILGPISEEELNFFKTNVRLRQKFHRYAVYSECEFQRLDLEPDSLFDQGEILLRNSTRKLFIAFSIDSVPYDTLKRLIDSPNIANQVAIPFTESKSLQVQTNSGDPILYDQDRPESPTVASLNRKTQTKQEASPHNHLNDQPVHPTVEAGIRKNDPVKNGEVNKLLNRVIKQDTRKVSFSEP